MKQNGRSANSYFIFMLLLLVLIIGLNMVTSHREDYTKTEFLTDLQNGNVSEVVISPNGEAPTGYATVELKNGQTKILYATDITELEELVVQQGYDPVVTDIERESWFMNVLLPMLIVLGVGIFFFMMFNAQSAGGGGGKMANFGKRPWVIKTLPLSRWQV